MKYKYPLSYAEFHSTYKTDKSSAWKNYTTYGGMPAVLDQSSEQKKKNYLNNLFNIKKYYFTDIGLRNARLNFRQQEENHLMENIIYNELILRGYSVDVGAIKIRENANARNNLEIDFICNQADKRYYVQSALNIVAREKTNKNQDH